MKNIIEKYQYKIKNIIKSFTGSYNEDIEQEVYIRTWKNMDKYKECNKFSSWIGVVASNICRDYLKSSSNKMSQNTNYDNELLKNVKDNKETPENTFDSTQRQKKILKEINRLPKKLKEVIILYELEDRNYEEISLILNIPKGTVKSRLYNAREILRNTLKDLIKEN